MGLASSAAKTQLNVFSTPEYLRQHGQAVQTHTPATPSSPPPATPKTVTVTTGSASDHGASLPTPVVPEITFSTGADGSYFSQGLEVMRFSVNSAPVSKLAAAASKVLVTTGGITFDLIFDAAAMAAPQTFRDGITKAASLIASTISDKITVNLNIDYSGFGGGAAAGPDGGYYVGYQTVSSLLKSHAAAGDTTFNGLPGGTSIQGQTNVAVWNAQMKALGLMSANDTTTDDGTAYFATDINPSLLVGVALHELTHALGRVPFGSAPDIFDLFRFTSPGVRLFSGGSTAPASYFSIDNGVTKLANFGQNSDPSDFLNSGVQGPNDPFNEYYTSSTSQTLSAVDLALLRALGYHTTPPAQPDLTVSALTLNGLSLGFTETNGGNAAAGASTTGLYLSSNAVPTTADTLIGSFSAAALNAGATLAGSIALNLPAKLAAGTYHIAAIADSGKVVTESNENNNTSAAITVVVGDANNNAISGSNAVLFGLAGNDTLTSLGGNNVFVGGGGNDVLNGGAGNDQFVFTAKTDGLDQVSGFHAGDHFDFTAAGFGNGLATNGANLGVLATSHFVASATTPTVTTPEFWFNTADHTLYFDAPGAAPIALAHLTNTYVLHNTDILMV